MKDIHYNDVMIKFYDPVYNNFPFLKAGEKFYHDEIKNSNGPVLEAGVGTGRIFVPALQSGCDVYGIDQSDLMLKQLKGKISEKNHYRVSVNDMRDFRLDKKFDLVISPFRVFQHLITIDDQLNALNCIYEHLNPGGRLIFDVFNPDLKRLTQDTENVLEYDGEYEPGKMLKRFASVKYDNKNQILNLTFKFVWDENGEVKEEEFFTPLRYYFRYELENLINRTKFTLDKLYGDFEGNLFDANPKEFIVVCKK